MGLNDRVRFRLREEKERRRVSERDIAGQIAWSQSKVASKLIGRTAITLDELEQLCFALDLPLAEAVRNRGLEWCAEMTPTELARLHLWRELPKPVQDHLDRFMRLEQSQIEQRGATPRRSRAPKPRKIV